MENRPTDGFVQSAEQAIERPKEIATNVPKMETTDQEEEEEVRITTDQGAEVEISAEQIITIRSCLETWQSSSRSSSRASRILIRFV
jgi:hypothetical protein